MLGKLFVDHPRTVGETYEEHWLVAMRFGVLMLLAGMAAVVHAFIPGLFVRTGSDLVKKLNREMTGRGSQSANKAPASTMERWLPEYEI